ncbi:MULTISPECIES: DUF6352 family protein [Bradyrhizobium]|jgi:hypothetical protein|uniref:Uncharacterized protein n=2 Tax=Bradyrhizobium TaxID=374 RepID=A0ABY0PFH9_9BRAD|nr:MULTISPECIES: DUF6352 family protein [Bradyrhizobium]SDI01807.1 hypothetical protein SAMN05444163_1659 [Bradyrhizobium ottawaense]SED88101.1 hypothetical protein SAMN05444171_5512 [Bradyrhizobium lablabi]SHL84450.1 hypothetical protein SAMN05444321_4303 [Bradyrhizobium lablabi]
MKDFWISCGHHLLDRNPNGGLMVTDEYLKAYFARPELMPPADACAIELRLHRELLADPRRPVGAQEVAEMADADARENWQFVLAFRDLLLRHPTLEAAYLALVRSGAIHLPPLFVNQLVHVILRNALDGCDDPFVLRAAELFFRPQRIIPHERLLLLGDEEVLGGLSPTPVLSLMSMLDAPNEAQIDILSDENADSYWQRSDHFDLGLDLGEGRRVAKALGEAMRRWVSHLLGIEVVIEPLSQLRDAKLSWYVGLDAEGTRIGDRLWHGETLDERTAGRLLALFHLDFSDPAVLADAVGQEPVYLIMALSSDQSLRMKPQNLLTGLPIKHLEAAT